jgi:hypothetical protein
MDLAKGIGLGFAMAMVVVLAFLAIEFRGYGPIYADMGDVQLPVLTALTILPVWLIGAPIGGAAACAALLLKRPRSLTPYVVVAVLLVVAVVLTWYGPRLPIFSLAGNIKAD